MTAVLLLAGWCAAQVPLGEDERPRGSRPSKFIRIEDGVRIDEANVRTARETLSRSTATPTWTNTPGFDSDVFTFARVIFQSDPGRYESRGRFPNLGWWVDYPDADLNLSWRLQQLTSVRTDPDARVLELTDPDLHDYPLLYLEHAGYMQLTDEEVRRLRGYLASGGALFVNDFWSQREWDGFAGQVARAIPDRTWEELSLEHPIFHAIYDLRVPLHELRVPTMQLWDRSFDPRDPGSAPHRIDRGEGSDRMSIRVLRDIAGRIQVVAIHNSDLSDGWEREGESDFYFETFSEKVAYPLALNLIVHLMTH